MSQTSTDAESTDVRLKPLKPWLSFDEQLKILESRGLLIGDRPKALDHLQRIGYYRLSGYWYPLRTINKPASAIDFPIRSDQFIEGSSFKDVVQLYIFDKKLRLLALDALERIELAVRVDVAHALGKHDPLAHTMAEHLHGNFAKKVIPDGANKGKTQHDVWLAKYNALLSRARRQPFVEHHIKRYGQLPIWVAIEIWDFGLLSHLFSGLTHADQKAIALTYSASDGQTFAKWLRSLNYIRNVAAHHGRLWNLNVVERSPVPRNLPNSLDNARPYLYFCLMQLLLQIIAPDSSWGERVKSLLINEFPTTLNGALKLSDFGVVQDWQLSATWQKRAHK